MVKDQSGRIEAESTRGYDDPDADTLDDYLQGQLGAAKTLMGHRKRLLNDRSHGIQSEDGEDDDSLPIATRDSSVASQGAQRRC